MSDEKPESGIDSSFLSIFAHDVTGPLGAVKGAIDLVTHLGDLNEKQLHYLQRAEAGLIRIETIVNNFLDYARLSENVPLDYEAFNLSEMVEEVIDLFSAELTTKNIKLQFDVDPELDAVEGDEDLLTHVVQNLVSNAIKYNEKDGKIWVNISDERDYVRVDVQDTGIGIATEELNKIFEKYYRGRTSDVTIKGNGLGLAIAKMIIDKHGGHIWANSTVNEGSTFSFTIPRDSRHGMGSNVTDSGIQSALKGFSISYRESAAESMDDVDDNMQESKQSGEDSPRDEY